MKRFGLVGTVHLVLEKDGRVLMLKRANTGYMDGQFSLVAGHVEEGESVRDAMVREALEEIGLQIDPGALRMLHVMHRNENESRVDFFFGAPFEKEPENCEPHKCSGLGWFLLDSLPENTVPYIRTALEKIRDGAKYSELYWETLKSSKNK